MKQRNKMRICDMTHDYWLYFEENYVQKDSESEKNRLRNDGKTSNDGDVSTKWLYKTLLEILIASTYLENNVGRGLLQILGGMNMLLCGLSLSI